MEVAVLTGSVSRYWCGFFLIAGSKSSLLLTFVFIRAHRSSDYHRGARNRTTVMANVLEAP